jgi:exopolysaccharide production protein ExoQ
MLKAFEKLFAMAMLAYGCGAFGLLLIGRISEGQKLAPEMHTSGLAAQIGFHAVAALLYILHAKKLSLAIVRTPWLVALVLFAVCSAAWSQDPNLTFRRGLILIGTFLFGLYFGSRFELKEQIHILAWMLLLALMASAALAIAAPNLAVESGGHLGEWRGLFSQKNALARIAVLAILVFVFWRPSYRPLRYFALGFAILMLAMTRSGTGLVVLIGLLLVRPLFRLVRTQPKVLVPLAMLLLTAGAVLSVVLVTNADIALALLGRDSTLTGRTTLWHECLVSIMKRPILGYGFDAFWLGAQGEAGRVVRSVHWLVQHAHNGALQLWLDLGAIGLTLFGVAYAVCVRKSLRFYLRHEGHLRAWPLAYLAFILFYNFTEVTELEQNNIFTMLLAALAATVTLRTFEKKTDEDGYLPTYGFETDQDGVSSEPALDHSLA